MSNILLLGATSDMAVAMARSFAEDKHNILLAGRDKESLSSLKNDIVIRYGVEAYSLDFDATDFASHALFYNSLPLQPDITICIFGYLGNEAKAEKDWSEAERIIQTNYTGAVSILNIVANDYEAKKKGIIIGISSVAGERGRQSNYIYGSAKAGFTAYLSGLRNRLHKSNVAVITVLPGFVYTKMTAELKLPVLLTATPEQVAKVIKKASAKKKNTVYVKWHWKWIMRIIKTIPESTFKKMKL